MQYYVTGDARRFLLDIPGGGECAKQIGKGCCSA